MISLSGSLVLVLKFVLIFYVVTYAAFGRVVAPQLIEGLALIFVCLLPIFLLYLKDRSTKRLLVFSGLFLGYLLALAASTILNGNPLTSRTLAFLVDSFVDIKLFAIVCAIVLAIKRDRIGKLLIWVLQFLILFALINSLFVFHDLLSSRSIHGYDIEHRFGINIPVGLLDHKLKSAQFQLFGATSALALSLIQPSRHRLYLSLGLFMSATVVLHASAKEIFALIAVLLLFFLSAGRMGVAAKTFYAASLVSLVLALLLFESPIQSAINDRFTTFLGEDSTQTVRVASYIGSLSLAQEYFPFGSGAATFASKGSRDLAYSPYYYELGIYLLHGGSPEEPSYLLDTFWPKVLGQAGLAGLVFFALTMILAASWSVRDFRASKSGLDFAAAAIIVSMLIFSLATPAYTHDHAVLPTAVSFAFVVSKARQVRQQSYPAGRLRWPAHAHAPTFHAARARGWSR